MRLQGGAARLTIVVDELDSWHHRPLYVEIVARAHAEGLAGATAVRGVQGFAGGSPIHHQRLFHLGDHVPVIVTIVDSHERLDAFLTSLDEVLHKGVALLDDVEVVRYIKGH